MRNQYEGLLQTRHSCSLGMSDLDTLFDPHNLVDSDARLRAQLSTGEPQDNPGHRIDALTLIGKVQCLQDNLAEATLTLKEAETLLEKNPGYTLAKVRWLLEMGRLFILQHTPARARLLFKEAWPLSIKMKADYFTVEIAQLMADIEPKKGKEAWVRMALQLAEDSRSEKAREHLGVLYPTLGWMLFELRQFESSLEAFRKAVDHLKNRDPKDYFTARWAYARNLRELGRAEEALHWQNILLMDLDQKKDGRVAEEIAECLLLLNRPTEAVQFFRHAYEALSAKDWVPDAHPLKLKRLKDLGKVP